MIGRLRALFAKPYRTLTAREAVEAVDGGALLVDVREPHEWQGGHAPKARHIPLGQLAARAGELPGNRLVVLVCRSGTRSARAARILAARHGEVSHLRGGMSAWAAQGLPVVAKGGGPGRVV